MILELINDEVLPLLSQLIELRLGRRAGHQLQLADLAKAICLELGLSDELTRDIYHATLLCHIGFIGLPDDVLKTPYHLLSQDKRNLVDRSALDGAATLTATSFLTGCAPFIKHQYEYFNGKGYPDGLADADIPIGSRIIAVVNDFDDLQIGYYFGKRLTRQQAKSVIRENSSIKFDPAIVTALINISHREQTHYESLCEQVLPPENLRDGMILTQDLILNNGLILLKQGKKLGSADIAALARVNKLYPSSLSVHVKT